MEQITAAWTWDSWTGRKMKLGFGAEGSKYLRFCEEDSRTVENEEVFGVKKEVGSGMEMSELRVRHWMNLS